MLGGARPRNWRTGADSNRVWISYLYTNHARLVLSLENELQMKKMIEIDARLSDCIAIAIHQRAPIYVSLDVWEEVEGMREVLRKTQGEA